MTNYVVLLITCRKDVRLPQQLQRAMAAEAEASREARAKVQPFKFLSFSHFDWLINTYFLYNASIFISLLNA